jgi:hypothetical protein
MNKITLIIINPIVLIFLYLFVFTIDEEKFLILHYGFYPLLTYLVSRIIIKIFKIKYPEQEYKFTILYIFLFNLFFFKLIIESLNTNIVGFILIEIGLYLILELLLKLRAKQK